MKLELCNLSKRYVDADRELTVIDDLNSTLPESGTLAIIGRSGVGKSTLLHLIGGLDRPSQGTVKFDDVDLYSLKHDQLSSFRGENIGFVFQFHHLLPEFSALENTAMPLLIAGMAEDEAFNTALELLNRVELSERATHRPGQLSGGEQQRVAIARAIVTKPPVILADEPTGNLDAGTAEDVQKLLVEINRELNNLLIIVTHNLELAAQMDQVLEMQPGGGLLAKQ